MFKAFIVWICCVKITVGIICYYCDNASTPHGCTSKRTCEQNEVCSASQNPDVQGVLFYQLGCLHKQTCLLLDIPNIVGRRAPISITKCCETDNCNRDVLCGQGNCAPVSTLSCEDGPEVDCKNPGILPLICGESELQMKCRKSCGLCPTVIPPLTTITTAVIPPCVDQLDDCMESNFQNAVCGRPEAIYFCKKSCHLCSLRCYNCKNLDTVTKCFFRTTCSTEELCMASRYPDEKGIDIYNLGCMHQTVCQLIDRVNSEVFGKRTLSSLTKCCSTEECNKFLLEEHTTLPPFPTSQAPNHQTTPRGLTSPAPIHLTTIYPLTSHAPHQPHECVDRINVCSVSPEITKLSCADPEIRQECRKTCGDCNTPIQSCADTEARCSLPDYRDLICNDHAFNTVCAKTCGLCH